MNIIVDLNYTIKDGTEATFRSPVDCSQVTGLKVYYIGDDGNTASQEFVFADAHGNNVGDIDHLFAENVAVKVILDVTTGMAFVQNADTNAYLEGRFADVEMQFPQLIQTRYTSISDALEKTNPNANGMVGAYTDNAGGYHITLFGNIESNVTITINKDCTLHLNGHTLSFTAAGAFLDITANVTIDGTAAGSALAKDGVTSSASEKLVQANGGHLTINGGTYSMTNITGTFAIPIRAEKATGTQLTMSGCTVVSSGLGTTKAYGAQVQSSTTIKQCNFTADVQNSNAIGVSAMGANPFTVTDTKVFARAWARGANAYGINLGSTTVATINNCDVRADGYADINGTQYSANAIYTTSKVTLTINGGYYMGSREALNVGCVTRVNGGIFDGCQHGGAYLSGADIKVKNATFRSVPVPSSWLWYCGNSHGGSVYCGSDTGASNVYFDGCYFENIVESNNAIAAKYYNTNVYLSNCVIAPGKQSLDLRAGDYNATDGANKDTIFVGKNVSYDATKTLTAVNGVIDTTTYANTEWLQDM